MNTIHNILHSLGIDALVRDTLDFVQNDLTYENAVNLAGEVRYNIQQVSSYAQILISHPYNNIVQPLARNLIIERPRNFVNAFMGLIPSTPHCYQECKQEFNSDDKCSICLENFNVTPEAPVVYHNTLDNLTHFKHPLHKECLHQNIEVNKFKDNIDCPECREPISTRHTIISATDKYKPCIIRGITLGLLGMYLYHFINDGNQAISQRKYLIKECNAAFDKCFRSFTIELSRIYSIKVSRFEILESTIKSIQLSEIAKIYENHLFDIKKHYLIQKLVILSLYINITTKSGNQYMIEMWDQALGEPLYNIVYKVYDAVRRGF